MEEKELLKIQKQDVAKTSDSGQPIEGSQQLSLFGAEGYYLANWDNLHTSSILQRPTGEHYQSLLNAITTGALNKLPIKGKITRWGASYDAVYTLENITGITQKNSQNIATLFEIYLSAVLQNCWDYEKMALKQDFFYLSYKAVRQVEIVSENNPNIVNTIRSYHKNITSFVIEAKPSKDNKQKKSFFIQGQDRALFMRDIDFVKSEKGKDNGHAIIHLNPNTMTWQVFLSTYVGALFVWKTKIKNSKARAFVNYCEFRIRTNAKKGTPCKVSFDLALEKINIDINGRVGANSQKYKPKKFLLDVVIPEIEETQRRYCLHNEDGTPDPNLYFEIDKEKEIITFYPSKRDKKVLDYITKRDKHTKKKHTQLTY